MSTPALEERQCELELESVLLGRRRYEERRAEEGDSATAPGMYQTREALDHLAKAIADFIEEAARGAGRHHATLPYLANIDPTEAAYLTIRHALDGAAGRAKLNTVAITLGSAVQDHINLMSMSHGEGTEDNDEAKHMRRLFKKVLEQVKKATTEVHRSNVWKHVLNKYRPQSLKWNVEIKARVGVKLIELFEQACNLIETRRDTVGRHDTPVYIVYTEAAQEWFADAHMKASLWQPVHQPMVIPPRDWTTPFSGGYRTEAMKVKFVLSHSREFLDELKNVYMPSVYDAVNTVQRTPWKINGAVLDVMLEAFHGGAGLRALFVDTAEPAPMRPAGIPEDVEMSKLSEEQQEALKVWKRERAIALAAKAHEDAAMATRIQQLTVAKKFRSDSAIWFPHYLDFRGRIYPFANYLNPQGDDVARGLLMFSNGKRLGARGAYWLKVHIANLWGVDKVSFDDRVKWVDAHAAALLECAARPLDCDYWMKADSPWQALAACFEFAGYTVEGVDYVSNLPIAMDGSCSGLQHFSAMLRDADGGSQVNLVPSPKPGDIYTAVATRVQICVDNYTDVAISPWKGGKVTRKIAKQPTMTYCYSASQYGMAGQIETAVRKLGKDYLGAGVDARSASTALAGVVRAQIGETVIAAKRAMDFLQEVAVLAAEKGLPINWTAPNGFVVQQKYLQPLGDRINVFYGGLRLRLTIRKEGNTIDVKRQAAGVAPNFVHACDSAHLMATVNMGVENGLTDWACIHDSFGCHAADVDTMHACIREAFIDQYTPDVLARFREEIVEQLQVTAPELVDKVPPVPPQGDLDLAVIRESAYFFV